MMPAPRKPGRPSDYSPEIADRICAWLAGGQSLRAFCRQPDTPAISTVCLWIVTREEFSEQYRRAREAAGYAHGDGVIEVVELLRSGEIDAQTAKAMMDGLKWSAERMAPKSHMPQQIVDHRSSDASMSPRAVTINMTPQEAAEAYAAAIDPDQSA